WAPWSMSAAMVLAASGYAGGEAQRPRLSDPPGIQVGVAGAHTTIQISTPMPAPAWALAERQLLKLNAEGAGRWADAYLDANGYLRTEPHFGISDGPDDSMEPIRNWPLAHALGGPDSIIEAWSRAWEGHIDQYSRAADPSTELAKDGIYYKEFPATYDWEHHGEGLAGFYFYGLSRPADPRYAQRLRRFAGLYMNEDPAAPNYDPDVRIIRSLFNGSRGPKLTPNTQADWNGRLLTGTEPSTRFLRATNVRGDHPLNLAATNLAFHAYLVTHESKYRDWLLEYIDAWRARIDATDGNIPSNIGLDGTIGGEWGGRWYGGIFGWKDHPCRRAVSRRAAGTGRRWHTEDSPRPVRPPAHARISVGPRLDERRRARPLVVGLTVRREAIAVTMHGVDEAGMVRVGFELLPQPCYG